MQTRDSFNHIPTKLLDSEHCYTCLCSSLPPFNGDLKAGMVMANGAPVGTKSQTLIIANGK